MDSFKKSTVKGFTVKSINKVETTTENNLILNAQNKNKVFCTYITQYHLTKKKVATYQHRVKSLSLFCLPGQVFAFLDEKEISSTECSTYSLCSRLKDFSLR